VEVADDVALAVPHEPERSLRDLVEPEAEEVLEHALLATTRRRRHALEDVDGVLFAPAGRAGPRAEAAASARATTRNNRSGEARGRA